jgi:hypothetical protein
MTLQSAEAHLEKFETHPEEISKHRLWDISQIAKFLSHHLMRDVSRAMEAKKVMDGFHHSIFHLISISNLNRPSFPDFPIENDKRDGKYN